MPQHNRTCILALSDSHGGFSLGLLPPDIELDKGKSQLNESQQYLWDGVYIPSLNEAIDFIGRDNTVLLHMGDVTHGNKVVSEQMTTKIADQFLIATAIFDPILKSKLHISAVRIAAGTPLHSFGEGSSETIVAELLKARYPKIDTKASYHGLANIEGVSVDYAHTGPPPGRRAWLSGNEARLYLRSLMMGEIVQQRKPPDLVLRGHYHTFVKEFLQINSFMGKAESWFVSCPSLCLLGDFGNVATKSVPTVTNGMIVIEIIDGKIRSIQEFLKTLDVRDIEEIL